MTTKLTRWFPLATVKPVRKGVYNVSCLTRGQTGYWYCYWDGSRFTGLMHMSPKGVYRGRHELVKHGLGQRHNPFINSWRGIKQS